MKESFFKIYLEGICVQDILIKQNLGDRQMSIKTLNCDNLYIGVDRTITLRKNLTWNQEQWTWHIKKLMSIIQVGYLGSSEPDLRSVSAKTTLSWGLLCNTPKLK